MSKEYVSDELWALIAPLIPADKPRPKGGRKPVPARDALNGILFVLHTGIGWEHLPQEAFGCCGMTCWRRLQAWHEAGVCNALHQALLDRLGRADAIDWSRAALDSQSYAAKRGVKRPAWAAPPEPHGSRARRLKAPCADRRAGRSARRARHRRECS